MIKSGQQNMKLHPENCRITPNSGETPGNCRITPASGKTPGDCRVTPTTGAPVSVSFRSTGSPVTASFNMNGPPICFGCEEAIFDKTIQLVDDRTWHENCLRCIVCQKQTSGFCHFKDNSVYCLLDFMRLHGTRCTSCGEVILPTEGARIAGDGVYHLNCFACVICRRQIETGDFFYLKDDHMLICKEDYGEMAGNDMCAADIDSDESNCSGKRRRTSISNEQLRILQEYYQRNNRPSKQTRTHISRKTGLGMRVILVWFQNQRAKERQQVELRTRPVDNHAFPIACYGTHEGYIDQEADGHLQEHSGRDMFQRADHPRLCSLDFLCPDGMPPNVELTATDLRDGEVIFGGQAGYQRNISRNTQIPITQSIPITHPVMHVPWLQSL